jgi:uncharacterized protein (DUF433 family)
MKSWRGLYCESDIEGMYTKKKAEYIDIFESRHILNYMSSDFTKRISINTGIHFGKPCLHNSRIPVYSILELIREGIPFEEIIADYYPDLELEDLQACIEYASALVKEEEVHII